MVMERKVQGYILSAPVLVPIASSFNFESYAKALGRLGKPWSTHCKEKRKKDRMIIKRCEKENQIFKQRQNFKQYKKKKKKKKKGKNN